MKEKTPEAVPVGAASEVMNSQPRARVRVVGLRSPTEILEESFCSPTTGARVRTRTRVKDPAAYFRAWRTAKFGGDYDLVAATVDDAVAAFSVRQPERDRALWLKVANGIGWRAFQDLYFEFLSVVEDAKRRGNPLRNPASAFQKRLNRYTGHNEPKPEGGAA